MPELLQLLEEALRHNTIAFAQADTENSAESILKAHVAIAKAQAQAFKLILLATTTAQC